MLCLTYSALQETVLVMSEILSTLRTPLNLQMDKYRPRNFAAQKSNGISTNFQIHTYWIQMLSFAYSCVHSTSAELWISTAVSSILNVWLKRSLTGYSCYYWCFGWHFLSFSLVISSHELCQKQFYFLLPTDYHVGPLEPDSFEKTRLGVSIVVFSVGTKPQTWS